MPRWRGRLFVETLDALEPGPVGCAASGAAAGRRDAADITVYKAMGIAVEDLVAAKPVLRRAVERGIGGAMPW